MFSKLDIKADVGKDPTGIANAALYLIAVMNESKVTLRKLARAAGVTTFNVRNRIVGLYENLNSGLR